MYWLELQLLLSGFACDSHQQREEWSEPCLLFQSHLQTVGPLTSNPKKMGLKHTQPSLIRWSTISKNLLYNLYSLKRSPRTKLLPYILSKTGKSWEVSRFWAALDTKHEQTSHRDNDYRCLQSIPCYRQLTTFSRCCNYCRFCVVKSLTSVFVVVPSLNVSWIPIASGMKHCNIPDNMYIAVDKTIFKSKTTSTLRFFTLWPF